MLWFPVCFKPNNTVQVSVTESAVRTNGVCNLPSVMLRRKGGFAAHLAAMAEFNTINCSATHTFMPLVRPGGSEWRQNAVSRPPGIYEIGVHYGCEQPGSCDTSQASTFTIRTHIVQSQMTEHKSTSPWIPALANATTGQGQIGNIFQFNITDICTDTRVNVSCDDSRYVLRATIGVNPKEATGSYDWRNSSLSSRKSLYLQSLDEKYVLGYLYIWLQPRQSSVVGSCQITATSSKQPSQLLITNVPIAPSSVSWHSVRFFWYYLLIIMGQVCISDVRRGLNITVVGADHVQPHFIVTRERRAMQCDINDINASAWMSYNFWY